MHHANLVIFGTIAVVCLGQDEVLVTQMVSLVGELQKEWQPKWERMRLNFKHDLENLKELFQLLWN
jgi:hypothetical protein